MTPVAPGRSAELARELVPQLVTAGASERAITVDQTNYSVVVGEAVVVKWLEQPVEPPHRGAHLMAHLTAVGFHDMPSLCGTHEENGLVVAVLTGFVPGAIDGWDWYVDELLAALAAPKAEAGALHTPLDSAERIGRLSARMCNALATSSPLIVGPRVTASLQGEYERGIELLAEAAQCTTGDVAESLAHRTARIRAAIEALAVASPVTAQPIHGDLHVGQMLRTTERLLINDFDGSPVAGSPDPLSLRSATVDLASLVQSVDHVGRIAARRMPTHLDRIHEFIAAGTARTRDAFLTELDPALAPSPTELDAVLTGLCVVQELHELVYAARHLPRWMYVPHASLASMFPDEVIR